ncbi:MAG: hypothetical protein QXT43_00955 [Candidatus Micrarchaeaceae archaeon]
MNTKVLIFGVLLLIVGVVVAGGSFSSALPSFYSNSSTQILSVGAGSEKYLAIHLNSTGGFSISYNSSAPVLFIVANSSAFYAIGSNPSAAVQAAKSLEGKGVFELVNGSSGVFPYENFTAENAAIHVSVPEYDSSEFVFGPGEYYALFLNMGNETASIEARYATVASFVLPKNQTVQSVKSGSFAASSALILIGLLLIIVSFFIKGKSKQQFSQEEIDRLYSGIGEAREPRGSGSKRSIRAKRVGRKSDKGFKKRKR